MSPRSAVSAAVSAALISSLLGGCPGRSTDNTNSNDNNDRGTPSLTTREHASAAGTLAAIAALATSSGGVQGATSENTGETGQRIPGTDIIAQFGDCPVVTISGDEDANTLSVEADFGDGCEPIAGSGYSLSGVAEGDVNYGRQSISLGFDELTSAAGELTGEVALDFDRVGSRLELSGTFDIALRSDDGRLVSTDGNGAAYFDTDDAATTIGDFRGTVIDNTGLWTIKLTQVRVSFAVNQNLVPFAGVAVISGDGLRDMRVRFDADSPITGNVFVSVNASDEIVVNLFE